MGNRSSPPGATRSTLTLTAVEALELALPVASVRFKSGLLALLAANSIGLVPGLRKVRVNEAIECPSPPRLTYTPSDAVVAPSSAFSVVVSTSAVASHGTEMGAALCPVNETSIAP